MELLEQVFHEQGVHTMADIREVLSGQISIADQVPMEGDIRDDPFVMDLDDHHYRGEIGYLPHHYVRFPMVGQAVPPMAAVEALARFATTAVTHGQRVIFVSSHPAPSAMCAARTLHLTIGGTIQGAIMAVNKADDRAFADDAVLDVILALGGGAK